jgi:hypothetical protein
MLALALVPSACGGDTAGVDIGGGRGSSEFAMAASDTQRVTPILDADERAIQDLVDQDDATGAVLFIGNVTNP